MPRKVPNLTWRVIGAGDDRAHLGRWNPGPAIRGAGFKGVDLWAPPGPALTLEDWAGLGFSAPVTDELRLKAGARSTPMKPAAAERAAKALTNAARDQMARKTLTDPAPARIAPSRARFTLNRLLDEFIADKERSLTAKAMVNYRSHLAPVRDWAGEEIPAALTKELLIERFEKFRVKHGHHGAYKAIATLRTALIWAAGRERWRGPVMPLREDYLNLGLTKPGARLRIATPEEAGWLLAAFDDPHHLYAKAGTPMGERVLAPRPSAGDAFTALLWTAARVNDGLSFHDGNLGPRDGGLWLTYRPQKTRKRQPAPLPIPVVGTFAERLPAMQARRNAVWKAHGLATDAPAYHRPLIVNEDDGQPYWREREASGVRDHRPFNEIWNDYRALAAKFAPSLAGEGLDPLGEPWLDFRPQDCRDTAVTRLMSAGCDLAQIASWHGSSVDNVIKLARHYIQIAPDHAAAAGEKLEKWTREQGMWI